ncbi:phage tail tube protein [Pasteurella multocida]|nr:phage tail tube protein [Pasteurella multocida]
MRCNGTEYASADDAPYPGGVTRATVKGSRVYGYQETLKKPRLKRLLQQR